MQARSTRNEKQPTAECTITLSEQPAKPNLPPRCSTCVWMFVSSRLPCESIALHTDPSFFCAKASAVPHCCHRAEVKCCSAVAALWLALETSLSAHISFSLTNYILFVKSVLKCKATCSFTRSFHRHHFVWNGEMLLSTVMPGHL